MGMDSVNRKAYAIRSKCWEVFVSVTSQLELTESYGFCLNELIKCLSATGSELRVILPLYRELLSLKLKHSEGGGLETAKDWVEIVERASSISPEISDELLWLLSTLWNQGCFYLKLYERDLSSQWMDLVGRILVRARSVVTEATEFENLLKEIQNL
eukprot:Protomagalhaensia_wolfi_Nauph_80__1365@NODE_1817_length_1322_cov_3_765394_g1419_i0_p1_GENE_NODE_1817_length_1322_cov_3_765394_g1419_i0NODE_1817_length_1322_cov_3_765394_g1419_i0_p1_ORF_typecomplete_len157_score23_77_NODE_1817_length_1322_cov_3_765394_g1419_i07821252